ncbi:MAG: hypothetical protein ACPLXP_00845 [Microgenomates group bacterium]
MRKIAVILLVGQILAILTSWRWLPPELPLFYSRPWGKEQLTTPFGLFILPALSLIVFFINLAFISFTPQEEKLIPKMLEVATAVFNLLCLVTLIKIIFLVV